MLIVSQNDDNSGGLSYGTKKGLLCISIFILMINYLLSIQDMTWLGGDSAEIWKAASEKAYISYIAYKGYWGIVPYRLLYGLANILDVNQFFMVKIAHSIMFAYVMVVGIPNICVYLFRKRMSLVKIFAFSIIAYYLCRREYSLISCSILNITYIVVALECCIKIAISSQTDLLAKKLVYSIVGGCAVSLLFTNGGILIFSGAILAIYLLIVIVSKFVKRENTVVRSILLVATLFIGIGIIQVPEYKFTKEVFKLQNEQDTQFLNSMERLRYNLTKDLSVVQPYPYIQDQKGSAILANEGINVEEITEQGENIYSYKQYIKLVYKYPMDFIIRWSTRLFIGLTVGNELYASDSNVFILIIFYTFMFGVICILRRDRRVENIVSLRTIMLLSIIASVAVPCITHVDMPQYLFLQVFLVGSVIFNIETHTHVNERISSISIKQIKEITSWKFPSIVFIWCGFIIFCLVLYCQVYAIQLGQMLLSM